jgi:hypothetical protein
MSSKVLFKKADSMGKITMVGSQTTKEAQSMEFAGASAEEIADQVALFMAGRGSAGKR